MIILTLYTIVFLSTKYCQVFVAINNSYILIYTTCIQLVFYGTDVAFNQHKDV